MENSLTSRTFFEKLYLDLEANCRLREMLELFSPNMKLLAVADTENQSRFYTMGYKFFIITLSLNESP